VYEVQNADVARRNSLFTHWLPLKGCEFSLSVPSVSYASLLDLNRVNDNPQAFDTSSGTPPEDHQYNDEQDRVSVTSRSKGADPEKSAYYDDKLAEILDERFAPAVADDSPQENKR